jgi:DNA-binding beta-propeller fold protein YncE
MTSILNEFKLNYVYDLLPQHIKASNFAISPDNTYVLFHNNTRTIYSFSFESEHISTFAINPHNIYFTIEYITFSPDGKYVIACYNASHQISLIDTQHGKVTTFTGIPYIQSFQNGPREHALFNNPTSITFSPDSTLILVCDYRNHCIRQICVKSGQVSTFAGIPKQSGYRTGPKEQALFHFPSSLKFSPDGTYILICDMSNNIIRKLCLKSGKVTTFLEINSPDQLTFSPNGDYILVCDYLQNCISKVCLKTRDTSTFAGVRGVNTTQKNGIKEQAQFEHPRNATFSADGKFLFFCCNNNIKFIKICK